MGWRGTLRTIHAASRRAERGARRRQAELARLQKDAHRQAEAEFAAYQVAVFENRVALLKSFHQECGPTYDWQRMRAIPPPVAPTRQNPREQYATQALYSFRPSFFDNLLGKTEKKRTQLLQAIESAKADDERDFQIDQRKYEAARKEWEQLTELAGAVVSGDAEAYIDVVEDAAPLAEVGEIGTDAEINVISPTTLDVIFTTNGEEVIPRDTLSQLKSGRLSVKPMPKEQFWALYQDYVCSAALRVGRELFALLPVQNVLVTIHAPTLNRATGLIDDLPILSVLMPRQTMQSLNYNLIDPSDAMRNFTHRMDFKPRSGFSSIEKISIPDVLT